PGQPRVRHRVVLDVILVDELAGSVDLIAVQKGAPHVPYETFVCRQLRIVVLEHRELTLPRRIAGDGHGSRRGRVAVGSAGGRPLAGAAASRGVVLGESRRGEQHRGGETSDVFHFYLSLGRADEHTIARFAPNGASPSAGCRVPPQSSR